MSRLVQDVIVVADLPATAVKVPIYRRFLHGVRPLSRQHTTPESTELFPGRVFAFGSHDQLQSEADVKAFLARLKR